jgi:hypothetical protein
MDDMDSWLNEITQVAPCNGTRNVLFKFSEMHN